MADAAAGSGARVADAAAIAHDLANVIAVMSAACAMLDEDLGGLPIDHAAREQVVRIALAAEKAGELCGRLREPGIAGAVTTPRGVTPRTHDLASSVREACDLVGATLPGETTLQIEPGQTVLPVAGAALDAFQVVLNLSLNAAEAIGGTGTIRVRADAWVADRDAPLRGRLVPGRTYARLVVEDDGPGLPHDAARLFERGVSGSGESGRGTGLATVAAIAEAAGGAVRAGSMSDGGARVEVFWPLLAPRHSLDGACVLLIAGRSGPTARLADALEAAGAEPSLCLDPADAIASITEDRGAWDAVVVIGPARGLDVDVIAERLIEADPSLPRLVIGGTGANAVPPSANGSELLDALVRAMGDRNVPPYGPRTDEGEARTGDGRGVIRPGAPRADRPPCACSGRRHRAAATSAGAWRAPPAGRAGSRVGASTRRGLRSGTRSAARRARAAAAPMPLPSARSMSSTTSRGAWASTASTASSSVRTRASTSMPWRSSSAAMPSATSVSSSAITAVSGVGGVGGVA